MRCDKCGEEVKTSFVDGMYLCVFCYADYVYEVRKEKEEDENDERG